MFIFDETAESFSDKRRKSYKFFLFLFGMVCSTIFVIVLNSYTNFKMEESTYEKIECSPGRTELRSGVCRDLLQTSGCGQGISGGPE